VLKIAGLAPLQKREWAERTTAGAKRTA